MDHSPLNRARPGLGLLLWVSLAGCQHSGVGPEICVGAPAVMVTPSAKTLIVGESFTPTFQAYTGGCPSYAIDGAATWTSSDTTIARVDRAMGTVTARAAGRVVITGSLVKDARYAGAIEVTVR